jgi:hypothetical protein
MRGIQRLARQANCNASGVADDVDWPALVLQSIALSVLLSEVLSVALSTSVPYQLPELPSQ